MDQTPAARDRLKATYSTEALAHCNNPATALYCGKAYRGTEGMSVLDQVRNLERHAADIADLRGQHQKPMCGKVPKYWFLNAPVSIDASVPYLKY